MKKIVALLLTFVLVIGCLAGCGGESGGGGATGGGSETGGSASTERVGGKILFLTNMTDGSQIDAYNAYMDMAFGNMGYSYEVVLADESNDPAANLQAVQNAMTNDVVGMIACVDGGLAEIMAEYPDLYVAGFTTDMSGVYGEGGTSAACLENDHFLGTVGDQYINGADMGQMYFDIVVEKGYKKVATITFPPFAYPNLTVADETFRALVEEYNETADEPIEVVGEVEVLMFEPLSDAYFMESERQDLDAIIAPIAGCQFVYPTLKAAIEAGTISADTKLVTSGFESDESMLSDFGDDGVIQSVVIAGVESIIWPIVMLDNAIQGKLPADYTEPEQVDSAIFLIDSREDMDKVISSSLLYTGDAANAVADWSVIQTFLTTYNEDATYAELCDYLHSEALTVDGLK